MLCPPWSIRLGRKSFHPPPAGSVLSIVRRICIPSGIKAGPSSTTSCSLPPILFTSVSTFTEVKRFHLPLRASSRTHFTLYPLLAGPLSTASCGHQSIRFQREPHHTPSAFRGHRFIRIRREPFHPHPAGTTSTFIRLQREPLHPHPAGTTHLSASSICPTNHESKLCAHLRCQSGLLLLALPPHLLLLQAC